VSRGAHPVAFFLVGVAACVRPSPSPAPRDLGGADRPQIAIDAMTSEDAAPRAYDAGPPAMLDLGSLPDAAASDLAPTPTFDLAGSTSAHALCVATINSLRATEGRAPLARWQIAEPCVDDEARIEAESGIAHSSFPRCGEAAQNLCPGFPGATAEQSIELCLPAMWAEGPGADYNLHGHYLNMASPYFTRVACGFHRDATGAMWFVSDFR